MFKLRLQRKVPNQDQIVEETIEAQGEITIEDLPDNQPVVEETPPAEPAPVEPQPEPTPQPTPEPVVELAVEPAPAPEEPAEPVAETPVETPIAETPAEPEIIEAGIELVIKSKCDWCKAEIEVNPIFCSDDCETAYRAKNV